MISLCRFLSCPHADKELAGTGAEITAIDISPELLAAAQAGCPAENVHFEVQNAYAMTYADQTFDSVVGSSVLHHLEIDAALKEVQRVLKPGGSIYFTEPNMVHPQIALQKNIPWIKRRLGDSPDETAYFPGKKQSVISDVGTDIDDRCLRKVEGFGGL